MPPLPSRRIAVVIWAALVGAVAIFTAVALVVSLDRPADPRLGTIFVLVALGMTLPSVGLSFWLPRRIRRLRAVLALTPLTPDQLALKRTVISGALCEGPALYAVVGFMVGRDARILLPWLLSLGALLSHFPGARRWERLRAGGPDDAPGGGSGAAGGRRPARMVRE